MQQTRNICEILLICSAQKMNRFPILQSKGNQFITFTPLLVKLTNYRTIYIIVWSIDSEPYDIGGCSWWMLFVSSSTFDVIIQQLLIMWNFILEDNKVDVTQCWK